MTNWAIRGIFTGTAADYANRSREGGKDDGPSLKKIGTGEGTQVYGWGLYGSNQRGVAERYAKNGRGAGGKDWIKEGKNHDELSDVEKEAASYLKGMGSKEAAIERLREDVEWFEEKGIKDEAAALKPILEELSAHGEEYREQHENVYEQTFFTDRAPGDESHLLKWYEPVTSEQIGWIDDAWRKENPKVTSEEAREKLFARLLDGADGQHVYGWLSETLGSPQAASEFLARAGIDGVKYPVDSYGGKGVKDGDAAGWNYVSFRDDNIRVDHKWTDGQLRYSRKLKQEVESALVKGSESAKQKKRHEDIEFSENIPIFPFLGLSGARVVTDAQRIRKMVKKHHLTAEQIAQFPEKYSDPAAVMKDEGGYVVLTDMMAKTDSGDTKPVCIALKPRKLRTGEVVLIATAMSHDAAKEFNYYQSRIKGGLLYADINKAARLGLEEETESILRTQASDGNVKTAAEYSEWSTGTNYSTGGEAAQGGAEAANQDASDESQAQIRPQRRSAEEEIEGMERALQAVRAGRVRVADSGGEAGEASEPGRAASAELLAAQRVAPSANRSVANPVALPMSGLVGLYRALRGCSGTRIRCGT